MHIFGPKKNQVIVENVLQCFNLQVAIVGRTVLEVSDDGFSINTFEGQTYKLTRPHAA